MPSPVTIQERKRLVWVFFSLFLLFCFLIVQFYKLQIIEGEKWTKRAEAQHQFVVIEPFKRGLFYSNTSIKAGHPEMAQPFVVDVPVFHLYIDPDSIPAACRSEIMQKLTTLMSLGKPESEKMRLQFYKKSRSRKLRMWLEGEMRDRIQAWWQPYARAKKLPRNALYFVQDYKRSYPFGKLLGQVLHTLGEDRNPDTQQKMPTGGLELLYNDYLTGKEGKRLLFRSPRHPMDVGKVLAYPEHGADIYLTVNHYLQAVAEEEIEKAVQKANAKGGWAIMMDPRSGEILALAQYPCFDPTHYRDYFNDPKLLENTKVRAIIDPYEPGSTFKPITLAIGLKANAALKKMGKPPVLIKEEKMATGNGHFPGRSIPIKDTHHHSFLNMELAMQKSSNIYMARIIQRVIQQLGDNWYRQTLHDVFGFGQKTGIELPSETIGLLPTPGKKHPNGALEWSTPTPFSLAFGHNILVNSMQMLRAYALFANGGYDVRPTLIRKIVKTHCDGKEEILLDNTKPERIKNFKRVLEPEVAEEMVQLLKLVTKPGGSASKGDVYGYTEAGKTGTSEKIVNGHYSKTVHFSSFIGFAPAKNPRFILLIGIDEPESKYIPGVGKNQMGGNCAAPPFREIATRTLQYLGVEPDDPHGYPPGDPRFDPQKADLYNKIKELKELYKQWNH